MAAYAFAPTQPGSSFSAILRRSDGAFIPNDPGNADYMVYLAWVAAGNVTDPPPPDLSLSDATFTGDPWVGIGQ